LAVNGLLVATLVGCGPVVKVAPFGQRPDSIKAGSLLGPFDGQVVDADTGLPLSDATVACFWAFDRGLGSSAPEAVRSYVTATNVDGRYLVPALRNFPQGLTTRLARLSLIVYRKEYVSFRHDRVFAQTGRPLFSQLGTVVRLARWSPELSRARHLLFLGGGVALEKASAWENLAAAAELDGQPGQGIGRLSLAPAGPTTRPAPPRLDAAVLISSDEVRTVTGYEGSFQTGRLEGQRSEAYDTFHLRATDKPERYDVAVRIWRPGTDKLVEKYEEILKALPGSKQTDERGDRSFVVTQGEILGLGILSRDAGSVVLLTCGRGQCSKPGHLSELAKRVEKNLSRLPPPPADEAESPKEEPPEASEPEPETKVPSRPSRPRRAAPRRPKETP
jgi:hypothetical protein